MMDTEKFFETSVFNSTLTRLIAREDSSIIKNNHCRSSDFKNIAVELLAHLLRIRMVPDSNLGPQIGSPYWSFSWLTAVPQGEHLDINLYFSIPFAFLEFSIVFFQS
jgi:hypothetical protein